MRVAAKWLVLMTVAAPWAVQAHAQTADEVVEKYLAAIGGRAALVKLQSRIAIGTIVLSAQGADVAGPIEIYTKAPNKTRTYFRLDLSQLGSGEMVVDQRCDGKTAFASNSLQGDREISGNQLQNLLNATFPTPLLNYKEAGAKIELTGKDKVGTREVYVLQYTPKAGSPSKQYVDAETYLLLRTVTKVDVPAAGGEIEQTNDLADYREVDGVKVPFTINIVSSAQTLAITLTKVEHNKPIDDAMFSRPAVK
jgi:outer membrane lipoprotein-sorting protein